jgi:hypothetical protein
VAPARRAPPRGAGDGGDPVPACAHDGCGVWPVRAWAKRIIDGAGPEPCPPRTANDWVEHLRVLDVSVGTYCIPAGGVDDQSPRTEDEIYVVTPDGDAAAGRGAVTFVPAGEERRFVDVTEDLTLLVVFGPAHGSRDVWR